MKSAVKLYLFKLISGLRNCIVALLWSDETKMELFGHVHRRHVWCQKRDTYKKRHLIPTVKYGGRSLMLRGCFAASGSGALVKINGIMNSTKYQDILAKNLVASARKLKLGRWWTFQQGNDPKLQNQHRNGSVKTKSVFCNGSFSLWT